MTNFGMLKKEDVRKHWPHDAEGKLGALLAEYDILQNLNKTEKEKFANLVSAHGN